MLRQHLAVCPSCRGYAGLLSAAFGPQEMAEPPAVLRERILSETARMPIPRAVPNKTQLLRIVISAAAAAACLVLCVIAAPLLLPKGASADSAALVEAADMELYSEEAVDDCAPAWDAGDSTGTGGTEEDALLRTQNTFTADLTADDACAAAADVPPPREETLAVLTCYGALPEGLHEADAVDTGEGVYYIYIDIALARSLQEAGMECSENADALRSFPDDGMAAVLWIP